MDKTVRALTDLCGVDDQLSAQAGLLDGLALALEGRRAALRQAVAQPFLAAYDALGRVGRRPVVVAVRGAHCGGCYLRLPPQLDSAIRRHQSLFVCPHCRRLLYASRQSEDGESTNESSHKATEPSAAGGRTSPRMPRSARARLARPEPGAPGRRRARGVDARRPGSPAHRAKRRSGLGSAGAPLAKADSVKR